MLWLGGTRILGTCILFSVSQVIELDPSFYNGDLNDTCNYETEKYEHIIATPGQLYNNNYAQVSIVEWFHNLYCVTRSSVLAYHYQHRSKMHMSYTTQNWRCRLPVEVPVNCSNVHPGVEGGGFPHLKLRLIQYIINELV